MTKFAGRVADLGFGAGWRLVRMLPPGLAAAGFRAAADRTARRAGPGARQLRANLARVVPQAGDDELDDLVRQALRSYARYWCETFRLPAMDLDSIEAQAETSVAGTEHLDAALAAGRGAVVALPHSGNFDVAGYWVTRRYGGFTTIVERLRPESLYRRFQAYRESLGFEILPLTGGERHPFAVLSARLRANKVICLVSDRDLTASGLPVTFFGEQARMPGGPAFLAARTGAALLPVGSWFTEDGWGYRIHPPIPVAGKPDVPAATQALADVFAGDIAAHPADWHMTQKLWLSDTERAPSFDGPAVQESAVQNSALQDPALQDPPLQDPPVHDPAFRDSA